MNTSLRRSKSEIPITLLEMCTIWAKARSKDPATQVGAVVYDSTTGATYFGYNGFPKGIPDYETRWERPIKYDYVIHAEENAIFKALAGLKDLQHAELICTHKPCHRCAARIIQSGIRVVYYHHPHDDSKITDTLFSEANVRVSLI